MFTCSTHTFILTHAHTHAHTHIYTYTHTYIYIHTHAVHVQDPSVTAAISGTGQDDYNPFTDNGAKEKEPEVKEVISNIACVALIRTLCMVPAT